ncbi:hypothetical protein [Pandoraea sp. ISTKB]|uniref:hypothetical protein n=1 Tax=Pandoraea sp. ISTKB TaxID=1586708 RepID=UPI00086F631A|nr:hypothetical protein [Pandoraea sp. ISTKB]ODP32854.1 hypothetical protein A9762_03995 [Pandoraea sp. ISTKB]
MEFTNISSTTSTPMFVNPSARGAEGLPPNQLASDLAEMHQILADGSIGAIWPPKASDVMELWALGTTKHLSTASLADWSQELEGQSGGKSNIAQRMGDDLVVMRGKPAFVGTDDAYQVGLAHMLVVLCDLPSEKKLRAVERIITDPIHGQEVVQREWSPTYFRCFDPVDHAALEECLHQINVVNIR